MAKIATPSCKYNDDLLSEEQPEPWLEGSKDVKSAFCNLCYQSFYILDIGISMIRSHANGKKHFFM